MTTDTSEKKTLDLGDRHAAGLYQAIALRSLCRFSCFRGTAEHYGAELQGYELAVPSQRDASKRYEELVEEWVFEKPSSATAAKALIEFAGSISADALLREIANEGGPVSDETDALHQLIALSAASGWLTGAANREYLDRIKKEDATRARMPVRERPDGSVEIEHPNGTRWVYRREGGAS